MNTANYLKNGKYPLSTETLSFIQDQIKLLEALAGLGGKNYIIQPDSRVGGIAVITKKVKTGIIEREEREVLELLDSPTYSQQTRFVTVLTEKKNIVADDHTYTEARIYRRAQFSVNRGAESYPINSFINFISHSAITLDQFPTNAILAERIRQVPATVLEYLKDTLAKKLTFSSMKGVTKEQIDGLRTSCVLSCSGSVALFGQTDYTLIVTEQGSKQVRQELIQGTDWSRDFCEGNSWHWSFCVFHDPQGLIDLMGGKKEFNHMMDSVFKMPSRLGMDSRGMIHEMREMQVMNMGQYAHGNQPIQHMVYLYNYSGEPWKAQYWVREIMHKLYTAEADGYCGDEDNGQTSAWYVFSALGFYTVCPGTDQYVLGTPLFKSVKLHLDNGKQVLIQADKADYF